MTKIKEIYSDLGISNYIIGLFRDSKLDLFQVFFDHLKDIQFEFITTLYNCIFESENISVENLNIFLSSFIYSS